jgi:hypothetical protein
LVDPHLPAVNFSKASWNLPPFPLPKKISRQRLSAFSIHWPVFADADAAADANTNAGQPATEAV